MAYSLNLNSAYYYIFRNLSLTVKKSKYANIQFRELDQSWARSLNQILCMFLSCSVWVETQTHNIISGSSWHTSMTRPWSSTAIWSAFLIVLSRCAITITVLPLIALSRASCTTFSDSASRALIKVTSIHRSVGKMKKVTCITNKN